MEPRKHRVVTVYCLSSPLEVFLWCRSPLCRWRAAKFRLMNYDGSMPSLVGHSVSFFQRPVQFISPVPAISKWYSRYLFYLLPSVPTGQVAMGHFGVERIVMFQNNFGVVYFETEYLEVTWRFVLLEYYISWVSRLFEEFRLQDHEAVLVLSHRLKLKELKA